jgi:hypothetical protein
MNNTLKQMISAGAGLVALVLTSSTELFGASLKSPERTPRQAELLERLNSGNMTVEELREINRKVDEGYYTTGTERRTKSQKIKKPTSRKYTSSREPTPICIMNGGFFTNSHYFTEQQINEVLDRYCSGVRTDGLAKFIVTTAKDCRINPALLVARLQIEQGLITDPALPKPKELEHAMGHGCFDDKKWLKSGGIYDQIAKSGRTLRGHYNEFRTGVVLEVDYGKRKVCPANSPTYAILKYTPHLSAAKLQNEVLRTVIGIPTNHFK